MQPATTPQHQEYQDDLSSSLKRFKRHVQPKLSKELNGLTGGYLESKLAKIVTLKSTLPSEQDPLFQDRLEEFNISIISQLKAKLKETIDEQLCSLQFGEISNSGMQDIDQLSFLGQSMLDQSTVSGFGDQIGKDSPLKNVPSPFIGLSEQGLFESQNPKNQRENELAKFQKTSSPKFRKIQNIPNTEVHSSGNGNNNIRPEGKYSVKISDLSSEDEEEEEKMNEAIDQNDTFQTISSDLDDDIPYPKKGLFFNPLPPNTKPFPINELLPTPEIINKPTNSGFFSRNTNSHTTSTSSSTFQCPPSNSNFGNSLFRNSTPSKTPIFQKQPIATTTATPGSKLCWNQPKSKPSTSSNGGSISNGTVVGANSMFKAKEEAPKPTTSMFGGQGNGGDKLFGNNISPYNKNSLFGNGATTSNPQVPKKQQNLFLSNINRQSASSSGNGFFSNFSNTNIEPLPQQFSFYKKIDPSDLHQSLAPTISKLIGSTESQSLIMKESTNETQNIQNIQNNEINFKRISRSQYNNVISTQTLRFHNQLQQDEIQLPKFIQNPEMSLIEKMKYFKQVNFLDSKLNRYKLVELCGTQRTDEWHCQRFIRLTASNFGKAYKRMNFGNMTKFVKNILAPFDGTQYPAIRYGIKTEKVALSKLKNSPKTETNTFISQNEKIIETGFWINPEFPWLGCSPDGLRVAPCHTKIVRCIEIKCPYNGKDMQFPELFAHRTSKNANSFFVKKEGLSFVVNPSHEYYYQIQGTMGILGVKSCDFVIYTSRELKVINVKFDSLLFADMKKKLKMIYYRFLLPNVCSSSEERELGEYKEISEEEYANYFE